MVIAGTKESHHMLCCQQRQMGHKGKSSIARIPIMSIDTSLAEVMFAVEKSSPYTLYRYQVTIV